MVWSKCRGELGPDPAAERPHDFRRQAMTGEQLDLDPVPQGNAECALQLQATGRDVEDRNRLVA
jgi:hypothetical protein